MLRQIQDYVRGAAVQEASGSPPAALERSVARCIQLIGRSNIVSVRLICHLLGLHSITTRTDTTWFCQRCQSWLAWDFGKGRAVLRPVAVKDLQLARGHRGN